MFARVGARRLVGFRLVFVAGLVALSLVFTNPTVAEAAGVPPAPLVIAETLAAPEEATGAVGVLVGCALTIACGSLLLGTAGVAMFLYGTQDTWMPVVKGLYNGLLNLTGNGNSTGCTAQGSVKRGSDPTTVDLTASFFNCGNSAGTLGLLGEDWVCKDNTTQAVQKSSAGSAGTWRYISGSNLANLLSGSGSGVIEKTVCGAGQTVVYFHQLTDTGVSGGGTTRAFNGSQLAFGDPIPDDQASQVSTVQCQKPDGTVGTLSKTIIGRPDVVLMPSCQNAFPGSWPKSFTASGGWPGAEQPIMSATTPTGTLAPTTKYPDCFNATTGAYLNTCRVRVWINGVACTVGATGCGTWQTWSQDHPGDTVECRWGSYVVALKNCSYLSNSYKPTTSPQTLTTTDSTTKPADPATIPAVQQTPKGWVDSCWVICTEPNPPVDPPNPPTPGDQSCIGGAVSWNPVDWIYVPVKCALRWAFVPDTASWDWSGFVDQVKARPPTSVMVQLVNIVGNVGSGFQGAGDCGTLADFGDGLAVKCDDIKNINHFSVLYGAVQVGLIGITGLTLFHIIRSAVGGTE